jgi:hypothetical protein
MLSRSRNVESYMLNDLYTLHVLLPVNYLDKKVNDWQRTITPKNYITLHYITERNCAPRDLTA